MCNISSMEVELYHQDMVQKTGGDSIVFFLKMLY